jgi:hypothetical protein
MSTTASFKQQCPSCEAMVPIRDANLIGRKIDCPKCKYRFVVEEPAAEVEEDEEDEAAARRDARDEDDEDTGRKSKGKGRRGGDDDEDEGGRAKKKGIPPKVLAMVGIGVVALVLLVGVGWLIFGGGDEPKPQTQANRPSVAAIQPVRTAPAQDDTAGAESTTKTAVAGNTDAITNMINPEAEGIVNIRLQELARTEAGRMVFDSAGSFRMESFKNRFGLLPSDIDLLIQVWNFSKNWGYTVFHTTTPVKPETLVTALHGTKIPDKEKIEDQDYYVLAANPWFDKLGETTSAFLLQTTPDRIPARSGPRALRVHDEQTVVIGDLKAVQEFLRVKGKFPIRKEKIEKPAAEAPATPAGMAAGRNIPKIQLPGSAAAGAAPPDNADAEEKDETSGNYLTLEAGLKRILDRVEKKKPIISLALNMRSAEEVKPLSVRSLDVQNLIEEAAYLGASLIHKSGITLTMAVEYPAEETTIRRLDTLQKDGAKALIDQLAKGLDTNVELEEDSGPRIPGVPGSGVPGRFGAAGPGAGGGFGPPGIGFAKGGGAGRGAGVGAPPPGVGSAGAAQARQQAMQQAMGGALGRGRGAGGPGGAGFGIPQSGLNARGGAQGGLLGQLPGAQDKPADAKPAGATVKITQPDKSTILLAIRVIDPTADMAFVNEKLRHLMLQRKGYLDMEGSGSRIHELARASHQYAESHQSEFPRGTFDRQAPSTRGGRPYLPDQRVSWMYSLLPYLGPEQTALARQIDPTKSWRDRENVVYAATLIPQFLDPQSPRETWWVKYPKVPVEVAATHYVGIAGIGLDAPEYAAADTSVATKIGIFGYDRATKMADIKDGLGNTILIAEVPPAFKRPWLAGGGSTVMGVPEKNSIAPFVSTQRDGKRGTNVIMADGSVRFISADISDEVFKAMCTARGGEDVKINRDAPMIGEVTADAKPVAPAESKPAPAADEKAAPATDANH